MRAWDVHDGKLVWTFHSVPRAGEPFNDTWAPDTWKNRSGVNVWGLMTVDVQRGIVYMPFGAPATDRYGGDRPGDNLFSSSVVAADANTGKYLWHFQVVHHDIWDADVANPPILLDVKKDGKTIPAVGIMSKSGLVFLMDRVTGKSIYGVEERPVPQSEVPLERTVEDAAVPGEARAALAHDDDGGGHRDRDARARGGVQEADRRRAARRTLSAGWLQPAAPAVPRQSWRRELGRRVVQSDARLPVRQLERVRTAPGIFRPADHRAPAGGRPRRPRRRS